MLDKLVNGVEHKSEEFRENVSASDYVLAAHDYLLALATIELGSPDIPTEELELILQDGLKELLLQSRIITFLLAIPIKINVALMERFLWRVKFSL